MISDLPFEWFVLILRILFIFLLYFFVFQVIRVITRELRTAAEQDGGPSYPAVSGSLLVDDPGDSQLRQGEAIPLDPVTVIGRNRRASVHIDSSFVSGEHAQIAWEQGRWWATDLHSTNGTRVNSHEIDIPTRLSVGDEIDVGGVRFRLVP